MIWDLDWVIAALQDRGLRRVLVLRPFQARFSCETDVELLGERDIAWVDIYECVITSDPYDWLVVESDDSEWYGAGWPLTHSAM